MGNLGYQKYIRSKKWSRKRREALRFYGGSTPRCEICRKSGSLHIHHLNYENFTNEKMEDLAVLCAECHLSLLHAFRDKEKDFINDWVIKLRDSKTEDGKRILPPGLEFHIPLKDGDRYLHRHFNKKRFFLVRGHSYVINSKGYPVRTDKKSTYMGR